MNKAELNILIAACKIKDPASQKALFYHVYDFGFSIARRYANSKEEAEEIANDGFYKMLDKIDSYNEEIPFMMWLRKIMINTGIDHYRKTQKKSNKIKIEDRGEVKNLGAVKLDKEYLLSFLNRLSPKYKMVFVLHVMEGYSHLEIAKKLNISRGTSKSNLSKARMQLKKMISEFEQKESHGRQAIR